MIDIGEHGGNYGGSKKKFTPNQLNFMNDSDSILTSSHNTGITNIHSMIRIGYNDEEIFAINNGAAQLSVIDRKTGLIKKSVATETVRTAVGLGTMTFQAGIYDEKNKLLFLNINASSFNYFVKVDMTTDNWTYARIDGANSGTNFITQTDTDFYIYQASTTDLWCVPKNFAHVTSLANIPKVRLSSYYSGYTNLKLEWSRFDGTYLWLTIGTHLLRVHARNLNSVETQWTSVLGDAKRFDFSDDMKYFVHYVNKYYRKYEITDTGRLEIFAQYFPSLVNVATDNVRKVKGKDDVYVYNQASLIKFNFNEPTYSKIPTGGSIDLINFKADTIFDEKNGLFDFVPHVNTNYETFYKVFLELNFK